MNALPLLRPAIGVGLLLTIMLGLCDGLLADECERLPRHSVTIKRFEDKLIVNTAHTYKELTHLGAALARPGNVVLGLTRANASVRFDSMTAAYVDRQGRWECASPQLTMSYGFSPMTLYVAKDFAEGSCAYREIYRHELEHVEIYRAHLVKIENEITEALRRRFATGQPWRGPVGQTQARLQRELDERWVPYIQREMRRVEAEQARIDTPEEYARVTALCGTELSRYAR